MDAVYILKNDIAADHEELRHSVRSLVANWEYRRLWFIGGDPVDIVPDASIYHQQEGATKWERVRDSLLRVCACSDISNDFWLFNDDFFIMERPKRQGDYILDGTLESHVKRLELKHGGGSSYSAQLKDLAELLKKEGHPTSDYTVHAPMAFNRRKLAEVLERYPQNPMFRSLYGNVYRVEGTPTKDFKVKNISACPRWPMLSTTGISFKAGAVGMLIRKTFANQTGYENERYYS